MLLQSGDFRGALQQQYCDHFRFLRHCSEYDQHLQWQAIYGRDSGK